MSDLKTLCWSGSDVFLCGIGARTAIGLNALSTAAAVRAGLSGITVHAGFLDKVDAPMHFASDALMPENLEVPKRLAGMLGTVLDEALSAAPLTGCALRLSCWLGLPEPRTGLSLEDASCAVARTFAERSLPIPQYLPRGHAAGLMALQAAALKITNGEIDLAITAGVDSYQDNQTLLALDHEGWLMSAINRNGFPPGEAAAACVVASRAAIERLGLPVVGRVMACSTAVEPLPIRSRDGVCIGTALSAVLRDLIAKLHLPQERITATYCDLNGQRYRNEEFLYALLRTQEAFVDAHDYLCPADCWGDVGAASGLLYAALCVVAEQRGYTKGPHPLLWTGSESGYRSAVLLDLTRT